MLSFTYARPESMDELLDLLSRHGSAAKILAGGTDLAVRLRSSKNLPQVVIDLKRVEQIRADITEADGFLRIGARAVMTDVIADKRVRRHFPALVESASVVGSVQIRNRATLAGNICNASPAADTAPALLVYGAVAGIIGIDGSRRVPITEFFTGPGSTILKQNEAVEFIDLPIPSTPCGSAFGRITRRKGVDLATINLCCLVTSSGETLFAYGAVGPRPFLASGNAQATPRADLRGSRDYRLAMLEVMSRRSLDLATARLREAQ